MQQSQANEAAFLRLALHLRLVPEASVVAWVDSMIEGSSTPEPALIEAGLAASSRPALHRALEPLSAGADTRAVNSRLASILLPKAEQSVQAAQDLASALYEAYVSGVLALSDAQWDALNQASSMFDVAQAQAWGTFADAKAALVTFLNDLNSDGTAWRA